MNEYFNIIPSIAIKYGIDPYLIAAIINHESNWNIWATRYEPTWHYFWFSKENASKLLITPQTEEIMQAMSWGLGQIMGSVAREHGFNDPLPKLCVPSINIDIMCKHLKKLFERYGQESDVVSAYNLGSASKTDGGMYLNQKTYVDPVYAKLNEFRKLK